MSHKKFCHQIKFQNQTKSQMKNNEKVTWEKNLPSNDFLCISDVSFIWYASVNK